MQHDQNGSHSRVESLTETQRHEVLANSARRCVLEELERTDPPMPLSDLAKAVLDEGTDHQRVSSVEIELHHMHLPKLDQHGLLDYDGSEKEVVECYLDTLTLSA